MKLPKFIFISTPLAFAGCSQNNQSDIKSRNELHCDTVPLTIALFSSAYEYQKYLPDLCDTFSLEFEGFYPKLDTLPNASTDTMFLDNFLKQNGFTVTNSGWGNWWKGPRFMSLELVRKQDSCYCTVYKKYFYLEPLSQGYSKLKVTEKIVCNTSNSVAD